MLGLRLLVAVLLSGLAAGAAGVSLGLSGLGLLLLIALLGVPPAVAAVLVLAPLERRLHRSALPHFVTPIILAFSALFALLVSLLVWSLGGEISLAPGVRFGGAFCSLLAWSAVGALWGGMWRLTGVLAELLTRRPGARAAGGRDRSQRMPVL